MTNVSLIFLCSESENDEAEKEFGKTGDKEEKRDEEGLDRNMWAPEEDEDLNEVITFYVLIIMNIM